MNKLIPVIGVLLLLGLVTLGLGVVPMGDPSPAPFEKVLSAGAASDAASAPGASYDTSAKQAYVIDASTGTVLFAKNADEKTPTSSMSKVMSLYVVFDQLAKGKLKLTDTMTVSEKAWRMGGSKMFIQVGSQVSVEDLIRGVIIQSGNDAAVALAEGIAGSEDAFADMLNAKAKELGMNNSHFMNASGWPVDNHYSTAHDLAILAYHVINDFPQYYHYFSERSYTYNNITQQNRDPLLGRLQGADGLKTGHTDIAGYSVIGSAEREGRRVILVMNGLASWDARIEESVRTMEWAFHNFTLKTVYGKGQQVVEAPVWLGAQQSVPLVAEKDIKALVPAVGGGEAGVSVSYDTPVYAPVAAGDKLGQLTVSLPDGSKQNVALLAGKDVAREGFFGRIGSRIGHLLGRDSVAAEDDDIVVKDAPVEQEQPVVPASGGIAPSKPTGEAPPAMGAGEDHDATPAE